MKSLRVTIQIQATLKQYFFVALFMMLYKVVLTFESVHEILKCQFSMKVTGQYFHVVQPSVLYKVFLSFWG